MGAVAASGEWLSTVTVQPRWSATDVVEPTRPVQVVSAGESLEAAVNAAVAGDTIRVRPGRYGRVTITRSFSRDVTIQGEPGATVDGFTMYGTAGGIRVQRLTTTAENLVDSGAHDIVFDGITASVATGTANGPSCWYLRGGVEDIVIQNSAARGGWDVIKQYAPPPALARNIVVRDNDLAGSSQDVIHVDGAVDMTIEHNWIHDPVDSVEHNDGVQSQHSSNLRIVRNTFSWTSVPPRGGPNQAIMLGNVPGVARS